ncbi:hypothetical protein MTO96_030065 [Rhipicephalus appendiculatus]
MLHGEGWQRRTSTGRQHEQRVLEPKKKMARGENEAPHCRAGTGANVTRSPQSSLFAIVLLLFVIPLIRLHSAVTLQGDRATKRRGASFVTRGTVAQDTYDVSSGGRDISKSLDFLSSLCTSVVRESLRGHRRLRARLE